MNILITYRVKDVERKIYENLINIASIYYVEDVQNNKVELRDIDAIVCAYPNKELNRKDIEEMKKLKYVFCIFAGIDHIPKSLFSLDIKIIGNSGGYSIAVAEHVFGMILSLAKNLCINNEKLKKGIFDQSIKNILLFNKICGIIGFGGIGKEVAKIARAFGMKVYVINSSGKTDEIVDYIGTLSNLDFVLQNSDVIVLSIPLTERTKNLISRRELEIMKENAILINVARGHIIDQKALYEHMKTHPNFKVGLDVWWNEPLTTGKFELEYNFFEFENFIGSPHNSPLVPEIFQMRTKNMVDIIKKTITSNL
ncbi:MAG: 2-hydroxyacid dehydrogenase [candidate division WOR-3 bacterium]|nr:2-hydroxyacid dehydrogenase [candidate division WOR-3 bacterium]MCX7947208.1 2-hydroxyacid dehydrogenase [candidate division WOR-3 bacterium]MDW8150264.1 2-hydroxyacid dehydrogenase [candidate division WOR-3 bacterium]